MSKLAVSLLCLPGTEVDLTMTLILRAYFSDLIKFLTTPSSARSVLVNKGPALPTMPGPPVEVWVWWDGGGCLEEEEEEEDP